MHFFNFVQKAFEPPRPLPFEQLVDFFDELGVTLHCSNIGKSLFVSILSKFYANLMSILGKNAITTSVFFQHGFDPP